MNLATSRTRIESAIPKTKLEIPSSASPSSTVARTPTRAARIPAGIAPTSVPAAYVASRIPAPVFEMPCSSAYVGSSGVIAL